MHKDFSGGRSGGLVFPSLSEFSTVCCDPHSQSFGIVNKAEIDVFLELSCFFNDPADVGNLISGSSAFSKSSVNIWKFTVHVLLKPGLENFEHYFISVWDERNCAVVWAFFGIAFLWDWKENWPFPVLVLPSSSKFFSLAMYSIPTCAWNGDQVKPFSKLTWSEDLPGHLLKIKIPRLFQQFWLNRSGTEPRCF